MSELKSITLEMRQDIDEYFAKIDAINKAKNITQRKTIITGRRTSDGSYVRVAGMDDSIRGLSGGTIIRYIMNRKKEVVFTATGGVKKISASLEEIRTIMATYDLDENARIYYETIEASLVRKLEQLKKTRTEKNPKKEERTENDSMDEINKLIEELKSLYQKSRTARKLKTEEDAEIMNDILTRTAVIKAKLDTIMIDDKKTPSEDEPWFKKPEYDELYYSTLTEYYWPILYGERDERIFGGPEEIHEGEDAEIPRESSDEPADIEPKPVEAVEESEPGPTELEPDLAETFEEPNPEDDKKKKNIEELTRKFEEFKKKKDEIIEFKKIIREKNNEIRKLKAKKNPTKEDEARIEELNEHISNFRERINEREEFIVEVEKDIALLLAEYQYFQENVKGNDEKEEEYGEDNIRELVYKYETFTEATKNAGYDNLEKMLESLDYDLLVKALNEVLDKDDEKSKEIRKQLIKIIIKKRQNEIKKENEGKTPEEMIDDKKGAVYKGRNLIVFGDVRLGRDFIIEGENCYFISPSKKIKLEKGDKIIGEKGGVLLVDDNLFERIKPKEKETSKPEGRKEFNPSTDTPVFEGPTRKVDEEPDTVREETPEEHKKTTTARHRVEKPYARESGYTFLNIRDRYRAKVRAYELLNGKKPSLLLKARLLLPSRKYSQLADAYMLHGEIDMEYIKNPYREAIGSGREEDIEEIREERSFIERVSPEVEERLKNVGKAARKASDRVAEKAKDASKKLKGRKVAKPEEPSELGDDETDDFFDVFDDDVEPLHGDAGDHGEDLDDGHDEH